MVPGSLALDVVVEPAAQPWPGAGEGFLGDLEHPFVAGHQPRADEHLDQLLVVPVRGDQAARGLGAHRFTTDARGDQPKYQVPQLAALVGSICP